MAQTNLKQPVLSPLEMEALAALFEQQVVAREPVSYYQHVEKYGNHQPTLEDLEERRYVERDYNNSTIELTYRGLLGIESPRSKSLCCDCDSIFMYLRDLRKQSNRDIRVSATKILSTVHLSYFTTIMCLQFMKHIDGLTTQDLAGQEPSVLVGGEILEFETFSHYAITHTPSPLVNSALLEPLTWASRSTYKQLEDANPNIPKYTKPKTLEDISRAKFAVYKTALTLLSKSPVKYFSVDDNRIDVRGLSLDVFDYLARADQAEYLSTLDPHAIAECILSL